MIAAMEMRLAEIDAQLDILRPTLCRWRRVNKGASPRLSELVLAKADCLKTLATMRARQLVDSFDCR